MTADEANIKAILATQFADYGKGADFNRDWHDFLGDSIFTTDGDIWHNSRQLIRPQFIKDRLSDIKIFEKHCDVLLPMLGGQPGGGKTVDALDLFFRFTLDASTDFLLGRSVDSLRHNQSTFADAFNEVQHTQSLIARVGDFNWAIPRKNFHKQLAVLNRFVEPYIEDALGLSADELEKRTKSDEGYTFLHAIAAYTRDRNVLRDQLVAVLLAGRDTTACTLSWLFYELSNHPEHVRRLRHEIREHVGPTGQPSYENLKSMKFLQVMSRLDFCLPKTIFSAHHFN
jgi:cytochrome P450